MFLRGLTVWSAALLLVAGSVAGCTSDASGNGDGWVNNQNPDTYTGGDGGSDSSSADAVDGGGEDTATTDTGGRDDGGTTFDEESLVGTSWYGVFRTTSDPAITGTVFEMHFGENNDVTIGAFGAVTGDWEIFDENRIRTFNLVRDGEPNQPPQLAFDADKDGDRVVGLELFIGEGPDGSPYTLRLEQIGRADVTRDQMRGDWQSVELFTGENDEDLRLAMRFFDERMGYGVYNGAYIEFASGSAQFLTLDTGETYWLLLPPESAQPAAAFAGEIRLDSSETTSVFAPRQTNPGEEPAEFEALELQAVESFYL